MHSKREKSSLIQWFEIRQDDRICPFSRRSSSWHVAGFIFLVCAVKLRSLNCDVESSTAALARFVLRWMSGTAYKPYLTVDYGCCDDIYGL